MEHVLAIDRLTRVLEVVLGRRDPMVRDRRDGRLPCGHGSPVDVRLRGLRGLIPGVRRPRGSGPIPSR